MNVVNFRHRISPLLQPESRVVEITDSERLQFFSLPGFQEEFAVINPRLYAHGIAVRSAEYNSAAAIFREPAEHNAIACLRFSDGKPDVAARIFVGSEQTARAKGFQLRRRCRQLDSTA